MRALVLAIVAMGCRPLEPGETRCTSIPLGNGYSTTSCKTGQERPQPVAAPQPAPAPAGPRFYCATTSEGGNCYPAPWACERYRVILADACAAGGTCRSVSACFPQAYAACTATACYTDPFSCQRAEKQAGRNPALCAPR